MQCPHCKRWQSKSAVNFGKKSTSAECIGCRKKFNITINGRLFDCRDAPNIVASRNAGDNQHIGFRRAIFRKDKK